MATIADRLPQSQRAFIEGIAADRETQAKRRSALIERDGHLDFNGERCSPCVDCGHVYIASSLRLTKGPNVRLLCRSCLAQTKTDRFQNDRETTR